MNSENEKPVIEVSDSIIGKLVSERELILERELSAAERLTIEQNFIDQEVLVREAMARRLYLNDGQVRHRLADKMYYLLAGDIGTPSAEQMEAFYAENRAQYRTPELISFEQHFFGDDEAGAKQALLAIQAGRPISGSQEFWVGSQLEKYAPNELIAIFGIAFTRSLGNMALQEWSGPTESSRGWHVVKVTDRIARQDIPRDELQERLALDWRATELETMRRTRLDELRRNYTISSPD